MSERGHGGGRPRETLHRDPPNSVAHLGSVAVCTFDCYGTLIDWRAGIEECLGRALRLQGYAGTQPVFPVYEESEKTAEHRYAPYRQVLTSAAVDAAAKLGVNLSAAAAREFADSLPTWTAFPDTAEALRELGRRGVQRYILSNVDRDLLQETIRRNHLEVDGVVTAEDVRSYKPALAHWLRFFEDHPVDRAEIVHVAQSLFHDIVPASRLGLRTVWVNRYGGPLPTDVRPTYVTRDLHELLTVIGA